MFGQTNLSYWPTNGISYVVRTSFTLAQENNSSKSDRSITFGDRETCCDAGAGTRRWRRDPSGSYKRRLGVQDSRGRGQHDEGKTCLVFDS